MLKKYYHHTRQMQPDVNFFIKKYGMSRKAVRGGGLTRLHNGYKPAARGSSRGRLSTTTE